MLLQTVTFVGGVTSGVGCTVTVNLASELLQKASLPVCMAERVLDKRACAVNAPTIGSPVSLVPAVKGAIFVVPVIDASGYVVEMVPPVCVSVQYAVAPAGLSVKLGITLSPGAAETATTSSPGHSSIELMELIPGVGRSVILNVAGDGVAE